MTLRAEDLQTQLLKRFVSIMAGAHGMQHGHLDALRAHITASEGLLSAVNPSTDQDLFIEYNINPFTLPSDWGFEPSPYYDNVSPQCLENRLLAAHLDFTRFPGQHQRGGCTKDLPPESFSHVSNEAPRASSRARCETYVMPV